MGAVSPHAHIEAHVLPICGGALKGLQLLQLGPDIRLSYPDAHVRPVAQQVLQHA